MEEKKVRRDSLVKQISDRLEQMITEGVYPVGERIPTEPFLAEMFGVSRNTLREAVKALSSAGILEVRQGDGTYVRSNNRFRAHMNREYAATELRDIVETRNALELPIARLAARRRSGEDLENIREMLLQRKNQQGNREGSRADIAFHIAIAQASHNKLLTDLYLSLADYMEGHIARRQSETEINAEEIDELHRQLYLAIAEQDAEKAGICAQNILRI